MKKLLSFVAAMLFAAASFAQADEVTITVLGTGVDEEKATLQALRSAIEQTFGAFVSSNTTILNDELVQDEIVSVSTGNVRNYNKIAVATMPNGHVSVSLTATVSINRLISYAENKGVKAEFAGSVYATNVKLFRLKIQSIKKAYGLMVEQLELIAKDMFDFKFEMGEQPQRLWSKELGDVYYIDCYVGVISNAASTNFYNLYRNTVDKLKLTDADLEFCERENIPFTTGPFYSKLPFYTSERKRYEDRLEKAIFDACYKYEIQEIGNSENAYIYREYPYKTLKTVEIVDLTAGSDLPLNSVPEDPSQKDYLGWEYFRERYDVAYSLYSEQWEKYLTTDTPEEIIIERESDKIYPDKMIYAEYNRYEEKYLSLLSRQFESLPIGDRIVAMHRFRVAIPASEIERFKGFEIVGVTSSTRELLPQYKALWDYHKGKISLDRAHEYESYEEYQPTIKSSQGRSSTANSSRSRRLRISTTNPRSSTSTRPSYGSDVINRAVDDVYRRSHTPSRSSSTSSSRSNINRYRSQ